MPESEETTSLGMEEWIGWGAEEEAADLLDLAEGRPVSWVPGRGWLRSD